MAIKSVLVLLFVVFAVTTTSGLECYDCGGIGDSPSCADSLGRVSTCPTGDAKTYACLKRSKLSDGAMIVRGCTELTEGLPLGCTDYETLGRKECICTENKCNGAASLAINALMSLVPVVLFIKYYF